MTDASTFFPGQLFQNPDGTFSLNITGHVHAAGLDLDAGASGTPPTTNRLRWLRTSDGALIADLFGWEQAPTDGLALTTYRQTAGNNAQNVLAAADAAGNINALLSAVSVDPVVHPGRSAEVNVSVGPTGGPFVFRTVINERAQSGFMQLAGGTSLPSAVWSGAITGSTGAVRLGGTGSWSVTRTAVGVYTLTLNNGPAGIWAIAVVQANEQTFTMTEVDYVNQVGSTTTLTVKLFVGAGFNVASDTNWSFHAIATAN